MPLPLLVAPGFVRSDPLWPCAVASTEGSTVAVLTLRVTAVVAKDRVEVGSELERASLERKTSANPGAGTLIAHVCEHCTV